VRDGSFVQASPFSTGVLIPSHARRLRGERVIAIGRTIITLFSLVAIALDPLDTRSVTPVAGYLIVLYLVYALGVGVWLWRARVLERQGALILHGIDLVFSTVLIALTMGPGSLFFLFFVFSLLSGTVRFGWQGALGTAGFTFVAYLGAAAFSSTLPTTPDFELNRFIVRAAHLLVLSGLLIYLARYHHGLFEELSTLASWPKDVSENPRSIIETAVRHSALTLRASGALLAFEDPEEPWLHLVTLSGSEIRWDRISSEVPPDLVDPELEPHDFVWPSGAAATLVKTGATIREWGGRPLAEVVSARVSGGSVISVKLQGRTFGGRFFIVTPRRVSADDLLLARIVADRLAARIDEMHLIAAAREAALERDRGKVARDLHDGILQSLTGVMLQLQSLDRLILENPATARETLWDLRKAIETDHRELRRMVDQLRLAPVSPPLSERLAGRLTELAERMKKQWGTCLEFEIEPTALAISEELAHEAYSVIHESVANTAKHASASWIRVVVRVIDQVLEITVSNDGHGFPFRGRYDLAQLLAMKRGPVSLKERIALIGGDMSIDSHDSGSTLTFLLPLARSARA
jgi:signal transduction histidine kinase